MPATTRYEVPRRRAARAARAAGSALLLDVRASLRAAYGSAVACSGLLVGLTLVAGGVRL